MQVGVTLATGSRDQLRTDVKAIKGAVVDVTPRVSQEGRRALQLELAAIKGLKVPVAPAPTGGAPAGGFFQRPAGAGAAAAGATASGAAASGGAVAQSSKQASDALAKEAAVAFEVARVEQLAADSRLGLAAATQASTDASAAAATAEKLFQDAVAKGNIDVANRLALLTTSATASKGQLADRAKQAAAEKAVAEAQVRVAAIASELVTLEQLQASAAQAAAAGTIDLAAAEEALAFASGTAKTAQKDLTAAIALGDAALSASAKSVLARFSAITAGLQGSVAEAQLFADIAAASARVQAIPTRGANLDADAAARARLTAANRELKVSEDLVKAAQASRHPIAIQLAEDLELEAVAARAAAKAELDLAKAEIARARASSQALRGTAATTAGFFGLRGAVLAASGPFLAATVAITAFAKAVGSAANLETQLNVFAATTGATAEQIREVSDAARELGRDITLPGVSAGDAAETMTNLAKAGLSVEDSLSGARGVLQLATAAQIDNAKASEIAASALNAFGLAGEEATHVADLLANAANASQASIEDMGTAFGQANAVARQVGLSLEDTTAILTLLARNGLKGSDAGTSLRTALLRLVSPTAQASEVISSLGLRIRDAEGNVRPEVFADFGKATANLSPDVRDAAASLIFGQDAIRAVSIAAREGAGGLHEMQEGLETEGSAAALAEARTKGLRGEFSALASNLDTLGGQIGSAVTPFLSEVVESLDLAVEGFGALASAIAKAAEEAPLAKSEFEKMIDAILPDREDLVAFHILPDDFDKEIKELAGTSTVIDQLRSDFADLGLPTDQVKDLSTQVRIAVDQLRQGIKFDPDAAPINETTAALERAVAIRKQLVDQGQPTQLIEGIIANLQEQVKLTQGAVGRLAREGVPDSVVEPVDKVGDRVRELLTQLRGDVAHLDPTDPLSEQAAQSVAETIRKLEELGPRGSAALKAAGKQLANAFNTSLRAAAAEFTGIDSLVKTTLPDEVKSQIDTLAKLGEPGRAKLRQLGKDIEAGLAEGIEEGDKSIAAAQKAVNDAIKAGEEAVRNSVRSARSNLESLGSALADQVKEILDAAPTAGIENLIKRFKAGEFDIPFDTSKAIENLDDLREALDRFRDNVQRRQLRFNLRQAENDLRDARDQIQTIGQVTPEEERQRQEFLDPFVQGVQDAQASLSEFTLEEQIDQQERLKKTAQDAAREGIARLVQQFQDGKISAQEFATKLKAQLQPAIDKLPKANLGLEFSRDFTRTLNAVVRQAEALVGFLGRAGTEPGSNIEEPGLTAAEAAARVKEAKENLKEQQANIKKTADNTTEANLLLAAINRALNGPAVPPKPKKKTGRQALGPPGREEPIGTTRVSGGG